MLPRDDPNGEEPGHPNREEPGRPNRETRAALTSWRGTGNRHLRDLIHTGKASPSFIVSHQLGLDEAPEGYRHFDARDQGWTKVVLTPAA